MIGFIICMISFYEMAFTGDSNLIKDDVAMCYASCIGFILECTGVVFYVNNIIYRR